MPGAPPPLPRTTRVTPAREATDDAVRAARGDVDAFIRLYRAYLPAVYRYAYARLGNAQDAEDVTALVFERAWTSIPRYRPTGSFRGWLFTIAHRAVADQYRQAQPAFSVEMLAESLRDPAAGPEEQGLVAAELQQLLAIVAALRPVQQQVLALRFLADLPYDAIARLVGKREATVKMIAYRALTELRRQLDDTRSSCADAVCVGCAGHERPSPPLLTARLLPTSDQRTGRSAQTTGGPTKLKRRWDLHGEPLGASPAPRPRPGFAACGGSGTAPRRCGRPARQRSAPSPLAPSPWCRGRCWR